MHKYIKIKKHRLFYNNYYWTIQNICLQTIQSIYNYNYKHRTWTK